MRLIPELPIELLKHAYQFLAGSKEVRSMMRKHYFDSSVKSVNLDEILVSNHNHSCDGKKQKIWQILHEAAERGCRITAITDHNSDAEFNKQIGNVPVFVWYHNKKAHYAMRGMELNCLVGNHDNEKVKDIMVIGYRDSLRSRLPLDETILRARHQGALIGITSPLNEPFFGLNEEQMEKLLIGRKVDYVEIFNASKGSPFFHSDVLAALMLKEYNAYAQEGRKIAGIYVPDSHIKEHCMGAFFGVKKADFGFLEDPDKVKRNPELLIEGLRTAFRNNAVTNYGEYKHFTRLLFNKDVLESFANQTLATWNDYFHGRFSKDRARTH